MPHLRFAAYKHLMEADRLCGGSKRRASAVARDFDFDGVEEVMLEQGALKAYAAPGRGGHVFELDLLESGFNPLATMTRRFEDYHSLVTDGTEESGEVKTIHDKRPTLGKNVKQRMLYDSHEREAAVDRFFATPQSAEDFIYNRVQECGDFISGDFEVRDLGGPNKAMVSMCRKGAVKVGRDDVPATVEKTIEIVDGGRALTVRWKVTPGRQLDMRFGSEFNLAMLSGSTWDRYYVGAGGKNLGPLGSVAVHQGMESIGLVDEWQKVRIELVFSPAATVFALPVETVSQSEGGYELLYQQSCVIPTWDLKAAQNGVLEAAVEIRLLTGDRFAKSTC
jgi:alpha-amylase